MTKSSDIEALDSTFMFEWNMSSNCTWLWLNLTQTQSISPLNVIFNLCIIGTAGRHRFKFPKGVKAGDDGDDVLIWSRCTFILSCEYMVRMSQWMYCMDLLQPCVCVCVFYSLPQFLLCLFVMILWAVPSVQHHVTARLHL